MAVTKDYRPFKPGDRVYAIGPGLSTYIKDVGKASAEVRADDGQTYTVSIYRIYETREQA
jgi:preprotein translocase subunit YajC